MSYPLIEMIGGLGAGLLIFLAPPLLSRFVVKENSPGRNMDSGAIFLINAGAFFFASALLSRLLPHGWPLFGAVSFALIIACLAAARAIQSPPSTNSFPDFNSRACLLAAALATVGILDCVFVYANQSWGIDGAAAHLISPMQLDPQRNTNVANALLRGNETVFLPGSRMLYQLFWYHGAAVILGVMPDTVTRYFQVAGFALATAWMLYAMLFWIALQLVPKRHIGWMVLGIFGFLILGEGRLDDIADAKWMKLALDGSTSVFYQYFSLKLLALTVPQHALFATFFLGMAYYRVVEPECKIKMVPVWLFLCTFSIVASPALSAIIFPFYFLAESIHWRSAGMAGVFKNVMWLVIAAVVAAFLHWMSLGFSIHELFTRGGAVELKFRVYQPLKQLPIALVITSGFVGFLFLILIVLQRAKPGMFNLSVSTKKLIGVLSGAGFAGLIFWNIVVTDVELRRHFSMGLALISSLTVFVLLGAIKAEYRRNTLALLLPVIIVIAVVLEMRFVHAFTAPDKSTIAKDIPWRDYFLANQYLLKERQQANVIAASGQGLVLPISNEVATSLAPKLAILAHQRVTPEVVKGFLSLHEGKGAFEVSEINRGWLSFARGLGFDTVVWGPVEEAEWGYFGRVILLSKAKLLARFGEVAIFSLHDEAMTTGSEPDVIYEIACAAEIRSRFRAAGVPVVFEKNEYRIASKQNASAVNLEYLWANQDNPGCERDKILATPAKVITERPTGTSDRAVGRPATQSSTRSPWRNHAAHNAVDGRLSGFQHGATSIAHTNRERGPWWEVDLGESALVAGVQIWGKHPSFNGRLNNINIAISETRRDPNASVFRVAETISDGTFVATPAKGRYVRIGLAGGGYFVASEIQVWAR